MTLQAVRATLDRHAQLFIRAYVYGSVARGEQDEGSDVDLVLVRQTDGAFFDRIRELMVLVRDLGAVDLLVYTPAEIRELLDERRNGFLEEVVAKGVEVEGSQGRGAALAPTG